MKARELDRLVMEAQWQDVGRINARNESRMAEIVAEGVNPEDAFAAMLRRDAAAIAERIAKLLQR